MGQIKNHQVLTHLLAGEPSLDLVPSLAELVMNNVDSKEYLFANANADWLGWFWENRFLSALKDVPEDATKISYRMPELSYLARMVDEVPSKVVDIMLEVKSSSDAFNPEVLERFVSICAELAAEQLARVVPKIKEENWPKILSKFDRSGYEYGMMMDKLAEANDTTSQLILAQALLEVRSRDDFSGEDDYIASPFHFDDLSETKVFESLVATPDGNVAEALVIVVDALTKVLLLGDNVEGLVFKVGDEFPIYDVDFFTLRPDEKRRLSSRDDVRELVATVLALFKRLVGIRGENEAPAIFDEYFAPLPDSWVAYRLKLALMAQYPDTLANQAKAALFRIFEDPKHAVELVRGPEYGQLALSYFRKHAAQDQAGYVDRLATIFTGDDEFIGKNLVGIVTGDRQPTPLVISGPAGFVTQRAPEDSGLWNGPVSGIVGALKGDWSPANLRSAYPNQDAFDEINAEGVGSELKKRMASRPAEFLGSAESFFDRTGLHPHYTFSFLRGLEELFRAGKVAKGSDLSPLLALLDSIMIAGTGERFVEREPDDFGLGWLASWNGVHRAMTDVIKQLLSGKSGELLFDFSVERDRLFGLLGYLLSNDDPTPADEVPGTAKTTTRSPGQEESMPVDPFTTAINSVRGRAFETLAVFVFHDGKRLSPGDGKAIADDVKSLYEKVLDEEKTQAVMFLFGHDLAPYHYRDPDWIRGLLPKIFSDEQGKLPLYIASWEGYLSSPLYREMFAGDEFQKLYLRAIALNPSTHPHRRYFRKLDEGLANHLALAFVYFEDFGFDHPVFKEFWKNPTADRHQHFISLIGRTFLTGDNAQADKHMDESKFAKDRLKDFWDWALEHLVEKEAYEEFGFWINLEKPVFDESWLIEHILKTLKKTDGGISWEHTLIRSMPRFAKAAPSEALEIARSYFLGKAMENTRRWPIFLGEGWSEAFEILYQNAATKAGTYKLIDELITKYGRPFWPLEDIVKKDVPLEK